MNETGNPDEDDIYTRESPLPGASRAVRRANTVAGSNAYLVNPLTDFVLPFFLTHLIFWPVGLFCMWLFSLGSSVGDQRISMIFATTAMSLGGAGYGWRIGRRFTELTFISIESNREDAIRRGRKYQILMSVLQAILFPVLLWSSFIAFFAMQ